MTWIVGTATPFGFSVGVADVQVTFGDGRTADCLQKIHPIVNIGVGFAGDVELGFALLGRLSQFNDLSSVAESAHLAGEVSRAVQDVTYDVPAARRDSELIFIGVGSEGPFVLTLRAPTFSVEHSLLGAIVSIGSGSSRAAYSDALQRLVSSGFLYGNLAAMPGGIQAAIARHMGKAIEKSPMKGISRAVQACTASNAGVIVQNVEYHSLSDPGDGDLIVPPVARRWAEFQQMFTGRDSTSAKASVGLRLTSACTRPVPAVPRSHSWYDLEAGTGG